MALRAPGPAGRLPIGAFAAWHYRRMLTWARSQGTVRRSGIECTGSYGQALTRYLRGEGIDVTEVNQRDKSTRRRRGKTDAVDAEAAARAVISVSGQSRRPDKQMLVIQREDGMHVREIDR